MRILDDFLARLVPAQRPSRRARPRPLFFQPHLQWLEQRLVLSNIVWANRGGTLTPMGLTASSAPMLPAARNVVDAAIDLWERTISDFNQPLDGNSLAIDILMSPVISGQGAVHFLECRPADASARIGQYHDLSGQ